MIPVETVPGIRGGGMGNSSGGGELKKIYLIHYKNLCKCYNVPIPSTTIKKKLDPPLNFNLQKDLKGLLYNCILVHMITLKEVT
jgi:hypothetical protein